MLNWPLVPTDLYIYMETVLVALNREKPFKGLWIMPPACTYKA